MPRNQHVESEPTNNPTPDEAEASTHFVILTELIENLIIICGETYTPSPEELEKAKKRIKEKTLFLYYKAGVGIHRGSANMPPDFWRRAKNPERSWPDRIMNGTGMVAAGFYVSTNAIAVQASPYTAGLPDMLIYYPLRVLYNKRHPDQAILRAKRAEIKKKLLEVDNALHDLADLYNGAPVGQLVYDEIEEHLKKFPNKWPTVGQFIDEISSYLSIIKGRDEGYFKITHDLNVSKVFKSIVESLKYLELFRNDKMFFLEGWSRFVNQDMLNLQNCFLSETFKYTGDTLDCRDLCLQKNLQLFLEQVPPTIKNVTFYYTDVAGMTNQQKEALLPRFPLRSSNITLVDSAGKNTGIIKAKRIRLLGFLLGMMQKQMKRNGKISDFSYLPPEILEYIAHFAVEEKKNPNVTTHSQHSTTRSDDTKPFDSSQGDHGQAAGHQDRDEPLSANQNFPGFYTFFGEGYSKANQINDKASLTNRSQSMGSI